MDESTKVALLGLLKLDLGITHTLRDAYFTSALETAAGEIARTGVTLDLTQVDDQLLLVDYAVWEYRHRTENVPLARSIQYRLHNRLIQAAGATTGDDTDAES